MKKSAEKSREKKDVIKSAIAQISNWTLGDNRETSVGRSGAFFLKKKKRSATTVVVAQHQNWEILKRIKRIRREKNIFLDLHQFDYHNFGKEPSSFAEEKGAKIMKLCSTNKLTYIDWDCGTGILPDFISKCMLVQKKISFHEHSLPTTVCSYT